jgi:ABC-type ATPase involved in cell division
METILNPQIKLDELTSDEVKLAAPRIMEYLKEGTKSEAPELMILMGPAGSGKSAHIQRNYSDGFVWIDMARIFFDLKHQTGIRLNRRNEIMNFIGLVTLDLAILEKRNIVVELVGDDLEKIDRLNDLMKQQGYNVKITVLNAADTGCFPNRDPFGEEQMSSLYTEKFHLDWFEKTAI